MKQRISGRINLSIVVISCLLCLGCFHITAWPAEALGESSTKWTDVMLALRATATPQNLERQDVQAAQSLLRELGVPRAAPEETLQWLWEHYAEMDWFLQDQQQKRSWTGKVDVELDFAWYLRKRRDAQREAQLIRTALGELEGKAAPWQAKLDRLEQQRLSPEDGRWLQLYVEVCRIRRQQRLRNLGRMAPRIVFAKHYTLGGSHYAYTEGLSDAQAERHFVPGAELAVLTWDGTDYRSSTLLRDDGGVIRDPDVSWDGRRVLFAWKKSDRQDDYHLYEMELDTHAVRQLTFGLGAADYEGVYLPDGDIVFNSTRCVQTVDCWWTEVSNLYRCNGDGKLMRRLAFDQVHDNFPTVTADGRVLYTRWEYNDRGQIYPQPLLQMNADGTNQREFYGGNSFFPTTILHARSIPGGNRVLAIATGHHARQTGKLIEINPNRGRQENEGVQLIAPIRTTPAERIDRYGQEGELFQHPYPLTAEEFLVAYHPAGWRWKHGAWGPLSGVYWMNREGQRELLTNDAHMPCLQPIPVKVRTVARVVPSKVDYQQREATCYIQDVYAGSGSQQLERGAVRRLRVVTLDFRAAGIGSNRNHGNCGAALISTPVAIGNGTWDPKKILGETTVHPDGSAYFRVPARTPIYFQLMDERGHLLQTMRSWTTLQPGEDASCVGCHEHKNSVPQMHLPLSDALRQDPEELEPLTGLDDWFSFPRHVQPILDKHCVRCHDGREQVAYDLTATSVVDPAAKRVWSRAYLALTHATRDKKKEPGDWRGDADHALVNWVSAQSAPNAQAPNQVGSANSQLVKLLAGVHQKVTLSPAELTTIAAWIDLGVPFCGDYAEAAQWNAEEKQRYQRFLAKRNLYTEQEERNIRRLIRITNPDKNTNENRP